MSTRAQRTAASKKVSAIIGSFKNIAANKIIGAMTLKDPPPQGYGLDPDDLNQIWVLLNTYLEDQGSVTKISSSEFGKAIYVGDLVGLVWEHLP
jgi:hypothetical protein